MASTSVFSFERMTRSFEDIQREYEIHPRPLPSTCQFVTAMREVVNLFETLGTAFTFVKRDIDNKINVIDSFAANDPTNFAHLHDAVQFELRANTARIEQGAPPSCSRTLLRLMWALKFADRLLDGLKKAFDPNSDLTTNERTLKLAVGRAYDAALAENHSWTIRRTVKSACMLLPSKESFIQRLGVDTAECEEHFSRLAVSMSSLVSRMYAFYEENQILDLP